MNLAIKILAFIGGVFVVFVTVGLLIFLSIFSDMCANNIALTIKSPDEHWKVVVFRRDCGATTGFSTHVSVLQNHRGLPNRSGNIFSAEIGEGAVNQMGLIYLEPEWLDSETLLIKYEESADVYEQKQSFNNIKIRYQEVTAR